jgi:GTP-binding protein
LVEKDTKTMGRYEAFFREKLGSLRHVPLVFVSALTRQRVYQVLDTALAVADDRQKRVPTNALNDVLRAAVERHHPPSYRGQYVKINYATQVRTGPPVFAFFCNHPKGVKDHYKRYLEKRIRAAFGFEGVPLTLVFRQK